MSVEIDLQAAEYVLGTLSIEERRAFENLLEGDAAARAAVAIWQQRLLPLDDAMADVVPPAHVWQSIERRVKTGVTNSAIERLRRSRDLWRAGALVFTALAAALAVFSIAGLWKRPQPQGGTYIAVVNRGGTEPALIVQVNLQTRTVFVRPVTTRAPEGHSLQLWYVGNHMPPRSMGLIGKSARSLPLPEGARIEKANFAVSVEPENGSPTGAPTGPIIYSGRLLKE